MVQNGATAPAAVSLSAGPSARRLNGISMSAQAKGFGYRHSVNPVNCHQRAAYDLAPVERAKT